MKKRFLAVLLSLCMAAGVLPVAAFAAEGEPEPAPYQAQEEASSSTPSDSGSQPAAVLSARAGNASIEYSTEYGTFYFNPEEGYIAGFAEKDGVTEVVIPDQINGTEVTGIGASAFSGCSSLTKITIPASVTGMGAGAFWGCTGLTSAGPIGGGYNIEFGWTTEIPDFAFDRCSSLTKITVPASVTKIGRFTFSECTGLTSAGPIGGGYDYEFGWTTEIPKNAFAGSGLTSVTIPDGITSIGYSAFIGCSSLTSVTIPDGVTSIESNAFYGCSGLTSVTVPGSVTSIGRSVFWGCNNLTSAGPIGGRYDYEFGWTTEIPACAFSDCTGLTSAVIPSGITSIGEEAFFGCSLTSVTIPDGVTSIGMNAFSGCSMTDLTIPSSIVDMGRNAFSGCRNLTSLTILGSVIGDGAFENCSALARVTIPGSNTSIGANAFSGCSSLTSAGPIGGGYDYEFGWTTEIPNYAFAGCTGLTRATIPDGITKIGTNVFYGCSGLTHVTIPGSVTSISPFYGCTGLTSAGPIGGGYNYEFGWTTEIPDDAFANCSALTRVTLPDSVTKIGGNAFRECTSLTSVNIPDGVTEIGELAFYSCTGLTRITLPDGVTKIGWSAFSGCTGLTYMRIPGSVTEIGTSAFNDCSGLTSAGPIGYGYDYEFGWTTEIPDFAFAGCTGLTSVDIPDSVTSIGNYAFYRCSSLTGVATPDDLLEIGSYAFYECSSLAGIIIPEGVRSIEEYTFYGCSSLASVVIPSYVSSIGDYAFDGCSSLADVYYNEGRSQWEEISVDRSKNRPLFDATIHYYDRGIFRVIKGTLRESEGCQVKWQCTYLMGDNSQPKEAWIKIYAVAKDDSKEELYVYDENAEVISSYPWEREPYNISKTIVTSLSIRGMENKLLAIPGAAFHGYSNLEKVSMSFVSEILTGTFKGCSALQSVDFSSDTLKTIGSSAFKDTDLGTITLDKAVSSIGEDAFSGCEHICIECYWHSVAHQYALDHSIAFKLIDKNTIDVPFQAAGKDITMNIAWTPGTMFAPNSLAYNNDLAIASLVLSDAAEKGTDRVKEVLNIMGFDQDTFRHYGYNDNLTGSVSFTLAEQDVKIDGKDKALIACVVRGTVNFNDAVIDIGSAMDGFETNALYVKEKLENYISSRFPGKDVILFTTGHSLGAAVSGLVSTWMSDDMPRGTVFSYNFATPRNRECFYVTGDKRPGCVYNIINTEDWVTWVPPNYLAHVGTEDLNYTTDSQSFRVAYYKLAGCYPDLNLFKFGQHLNDRYMALILDGENFIQDTEHDHRLIKVLCPVDVEVVDSSGAVVGRIVNNKVEYVNPSDNVYFHPQDDEKYIYLFDDGEYTLRMTGTDDGTLNYSVEDIAVDGSILSEKSYPNVTLAPGKVLTSEVGGETDTPDVKLLVLGDDGQPEKEVLPDGNGTEVPITDPGHTHDYGTEWKYDKDNHWHECTCGDKANVAAHTPGEWIVDTEATETTDGSRHMECTVCGYVTATETIPAKGTSGGGGGSGAVSNTYAVSTGKTANGKVSASPDAAKKGDTVTLTVTPDKGYALDKLTVTDKNGDQVKLTEKNGKYTFTMPAGRVNVKASFAKVSTEPAVSFTDVPADAYYADAVAWAVENGVTSGTSTTIFSPDAPCTRAQAVTFLWRAAGSPIVNYAMNFTDVPADAYYAEAVRWAVSQGITSGASATTFNPNGVCTRAQIVTFLWRSQKSPAANSVNSFIDVAADAYYANAVLWAAENGITGGTTATTFSPNSDCTRAQIVTFLWRCMK